MANRSSANNPNPHRKCKAATVIKVATEGTAVVTEVATAADMAAMAKVADMADIKGAMEDTVAVNRAATVEGMASNKVATEAASVVQAAEVAADAEEDSAEAEGVEVAAVDAASNHTKQLSHLKIPITFVPAIFLTFSLINTETNTPLPIYDYDLIVY